MGDIYNVFSNSNDIIEWICRKCHRNFKAKISNRAEDVNVALIVPIEY